jgi:hypothetical protein
MRSWEISLGVFPGILFGIKTYEYDHEEYIDHVLYFCCFDICLTIYKDDDLYT